MAGENVPVSGAITLTAAVFKEGKALAAAWMKHCRTVSQAKKAKEVASRAKGGSRTRSGANRGDPVDLTGGGSAVVEALHDIATAIRETRVELHENTAANTRVAEAVDTMFAFVQNKVCFPTLGPLEGVTDVFNFRGRLGWLLFSRLRFLLPLSLGLVRPR